MQNPTNSNSWTLALQDEAATTLLAEFLSADLHAGDLITLSGEVGAGKTTFARALIRNLLNDPTAEVPSPTYTLLQSYEGKRAYDGQSFRIVHADLYRIRDPGEIAELGWEEEAENALVLVEWPEKAGIPLLDDRLDLHFSLSEKNSATARTLTLTAYGRFVPRLAQIQAIYALMNEAGFGTAKRAFLQGDASARSYQSVTDTPSGKKAILMISPQKPDGPPIRQGKSYSTLVHLAENVNAFVALAKGLRAQGLSAPEIYAQNLTEGLLLIEDLGREGIVKDGAPIPDRYLIAVEVLAALHTRDLPKELPIASNINHNIANFSKDAMIIEAELLLDWYWPYATQKTVNATIRHSFLEAWGEVLDPIIAGEKTWLLRDYHSPNLLWLPERASLNRIGLLDFQDCVIGHPAYDLASLTLDARVDILEEVELTLLAHYVRLRRLHDARFDLGAFTTAYATLGAQRATKILGIFVRLDKRDGKPAYLKHLPRIEGYLKRCLAHPALAKLNAWYEAHVPGFASPPKA